MALTIVTISANDYTNSKSICESINGKHFGNYTELRNHLNSVLEVEVIDEDDLIEPSFYNIEDFVAEANEFGVENDFIAYVDVAVEC